MGVLKQLANKIDIYGMPLVFEDEGSPKRATFAGFVLSIITLAFITTMSLIFGKELYERKLPTSTVSEEYLEVSEIFLKEYPLIFSFVLDDGSAIDGEKYFSFIIYEYFTDENSEVTYNTDLKFKSCDYRDYNSFSQWVKDKTTSTTDNLLCIDHKNSTSFKNPYATPNSKFLHISFLKCNSEEKTCADDVETILKDVYIQMSFQDTYVDINDYKQPLKYYENRITNQNSLSFLKRNYIRFIRNEIKDDSGWLFESYSSTDFIVLKDYVIDIQPVNSEYTKNNIYWVTLESPIIRQKVTRSYMKVQELLAKIGGLLKGVLVICEISIISYTKFKYSLFVVNSAIETEADYEFLAVEQNHFFSYICNKTQQKQLEGERINNIQLNNYILEKTTSNKNKKYSGYDSPEDKEDIEIKIRKMTNDNHLTKDIMDYIERNTPVDINVNKNKIKYQTQPFTIEKQELSGYNDELHKGSKKFIGTSAKMSEKLQSFNKYSTKNKNSSNNNIIKSENNPNNNNNNNNNANINQDKSKSGCSFIQRNNYLTENKRESISDFHVSLNELNKNYTENAGHNGNDAAFKTNNKSMNNSKKLFITRSNSKLFPFNDERRNSTFYLHNEFNKMKNEIKNLNNYWYYLWSILCCNKEKIRKYEKYEKLFSSLISFKKLIKIRSEMNNNSDIVNKSDLSYNKIES